MQRLNKILVPTDLSERSRRAVAYGCQLAVDNKATLVVLHVTNELNAWEISSKFQMFAGNNARLWPLDRIVSEAFLDLNHFLNRISNR
jgi:nucleotide-binding universal stress UspA family protein